jgi:hypothetical protein
MTFVRQWKRCNAFGEGCVAIEGAVGATYALTAADIGGTIRASVAGANVGGATSADSAPTAVVSGRAPVAVLPAQIVGLARSGEVLRADPGTWDGTLPIALSFEWKRCAADGSACAPAGNTDSLTLDASDVDRIVKVVVTAVNTCLPGCASASTELTSAIVSGIEPAPLELPTITGTPIDGSTLTATAGGWRATPSAAFTFAWQSSTDGGATWTNIAGATTRSLSLTAVLVGRTVRTLVTATNRCTAGCGTATAYSDATAPVNARPPTSVKRPVVPGGAMTGLRLTASRGTWLGTAPISYAYQWLRCLSACIPIAGATSSSYIPTTDDLGATIVASVTAANAAGSLEALAPATPPVRAPTPGDPDLVVGIGASDKTVETHDELTYYIAVGNRRDSIATGVILAVTLPDDVDVDELSATGGKCVKTPTAVTCALDNLAAWAQSIVTIKIAFETTLSVLTLQADAQANEPDAFLSNNSATRRTPVVASARFIQAASCSISGTAGDDVIVGTPEDNTICGWGGNDTIFTVGGSDVVSAGDGSDIVFGGAGSDELHGGDGADVLYGGLGDDRLFGEGGADVHDALDGAHGDTIDGGAGANTCPRDARDRSSNCR